MGTDIALITDTITLLITGRGVFEGCTYDKLEGWYDLPDVDPGFAKRPNAPGAFAPGQTFPGEAVISIEGQYFGSNAADALTMRERLLEIYGEGKPLTMSVADDLRTTTRRVYVVAVAFPWTIHREFSFTLDMSAADPRRYGATITVGTELAKAGTGLVWPVKWPVDWGTIATDGRVSVANPGNTGTLSTYTISGGTMPDGFALVNVNTGERLTYLGPVNAGTTIVLDTLAQTAYINGTAPAGRFLVSPGWWGIPARSTRSIQFIALGPVTGTPRVDIATAPAYY